MNGNPLGFAGISHARKERIDSAEEDDVVLLGTAMLTQPILNKTENMMTSTMSTFAAEEDSLEVSEISLPEVQPVPSSTSNTTSGNTANANAVEMVRDDDWKNKVASHTLKSMPSFYGAEKSGSASGERTQM